MTKDEIRFLMVRVLAPQFKTDGTLEFEDPYEEFKLYPSDSAIIITTKDRIITAKLKNL